MPTGLVKAKKYDWKDSNMAMYGSDEHKRASKAAAATEPAWAGAGQEVGLKIWRIEQFEVKDWPKEDYGDFFEGDSYILLNTYKDDDGDQLLHDVHFWIGKYSSQDEYGTAAYKTVELDTFLDDLPVQHRECQNHESSLFKSYFSNGISYMKGGCATGFRHVGPETYEPRLFKIARDETGVIRRKQIKRCPNLVVPGEVYILDMGNKVYQYNSEGASVMEVSKAMQFIGKMKEQRGEIESEVLDASTSQDHAFFKALDEEDDDDPSDDEADLSKKLLRIDTDSKENVVVSEGEFGKSDLKSDDVFILDLGQDVFVWVGGNADVVEKRNGIPYAHNYLRDTGAPWKSITVVKEGQKCKGFEVALTA